MISWLNDTLLLNNKKKKTLSNILGINSINTDLAI